MMLGVAWKFSAKELSVTKPALSCTRTTCHAPWRCVACVLGSDPLAGPGFQERI